jgi:hypothetical protein
MKVAKFFNYFTYPLLILGKGPGPPSEKKRAPKELLTETNKVEC